MNYFIAFSGRTGSSWLCDLLSKTDRLGRPLEHFSVNTGGKLIGNTKWWGHLDWHEYYATYLKRTQIPKDVTGAKLTWDHWIALVAGLGKRPHVDRWISLRRRDKLRQAISCFKNYATRQCELRPGQELVPDPEFDGTAILRLAMVYVAEGRWWDAEFESLKASPLDLWYEDLVADPAGTVHLVANFLEQRIRPDLRASDHRQMANDVSEEWYQQLLPAWQALSQTS